MKRSSLQNRERKFTPKKFYEIDPRLSLCRWILGGHVRFAHGAESLIDRLKRRLPNDVIRLNHEVTFVDWSQYYKTF